MAAGEYLSVSSQRDTEEADRRLEASELAEDPESELAELIAICEASGLEPDLATRVAGAPSLWSLVCSSRSLPSAASVLSAPDFGGAPELPALIRVVLLGVVAMGATAAVGTLLSSVV